MTTSTFEQFLTDLRDLADKYLAEQDGQAIPTAAPKRTKAKPVKSVEKEDPTDPQAERRAELENMSERALKTLAGRLGYDKGDIEEGTKEDIIVTILADEAEALAEAEAEAEEEEEFEEEEEEESSGAYERDDLIGQSLPALKKIAKDEFGETTDSLKGLDKEAVIAIILGEAEEDEEEEEVEEEEPEEEEEEEEEEAEQVDEEYLNGLSDAQLKAKAKAWGYTVKPRMSRKAIIDLFFAE